MVEYFNAKELSGKIRSDVAKDVGRIGHVGLAVILVGNDEMSKVYVEKKEKACTDVGIKMSKFVFDESINEGVIISLIERLNLDQKINGIIVQLPLPVHLNAQRIVGVISPLKDVDGLHPQNLGSLCGGTEMICPCTPKGVIALLDYHKILLVGKRVAVIGRSRLVGRPLAFMLLNRNATVTVCHTKTSGLEDILLLSDIIISAAGSPGLIKKCKDGAIVVNIGMTKVEGKVVGDVCLESLGNASMVTPILGCTGVMTVTMILKNLLECCKLQGVC